MFLFYWMDFFKVLYIKCGFCGVGRKERTWEHNLLYIYIYHIQYINLSWRQSSLPRIFFARMPLNREHLILMEATKSRETNVALQADWSCREWAQTIAQAFAQLRNPLALRALGIHGTDTDEHTLQTASDFFELIVSIASKRSWSMATWSEVSPKSWAGLLHANIDLVKETLTQMRNEHKIIQDAWKCVIEKQADWKATPLFSGHVCSPFSYHYRIVFLRIEAQRNGRPCQNQV